MASEFLSATVEKMQNFKIEDKTDPWTSIIVVLVSGMILGLVYICAVLGWAPPRDMLRNGISFFAQPHAMRVLRRIATTTAALWLLIRLIRAFLGDRRKQSAHKEARSPQEPSIPSNNMQQYIYRLVREIVPSPTIREQSESSTGCELKPGASLEQIQELDRVIQAELPTDYKIFLQLTNGLSNFPEGSSRHLQFISTNSASWLEMVEGHNQDRRARLFIDALFGPGIARELYDGKSIRHPTSFHKITSNSAGFDSRGVYLVPPEDCRTIARKWVMGILENLCGRAIGETTHHISLHFGDGDWRRLYVLQDWDEWLVLHVQQIGGRERCRLYPGFTAFLQSMNEISRGLAPSNGQDIYTTCCRRRWEWEFEKRSITGADVWKRYDGSWGI
ncbi:hypothetical protein O1611_g4024 [Lasiodiplodia mahajangana]|uniref:Uncharacterized protein n=1 Tax=Lasiodiplodia mahajangana TaxID=1108764 RepID=A0ACC2JQ22_9PEZI|nr:hypothetical protein O1611_g4024 [Lasiodiplodia mahajangana]